MRFPVPEMSGFGSVLAAFLMVSVSCVSAQTSIDAPAFGRRAAVGPGARAVRVTCRAAEGYCEGPVPWPFPLPGFGVPGMLNI